MTTHFRVLVADDEPLARHMVAELLRRDEEVAQVIECEDGSQAHTLIARERPHIVFLDIEMPEAGGLDIASTITDEGPVIVFVTAFGQYASSAFDLNASDYVVKPFSDQRLSMALQRAKRRVRERQLSILARQLGTLSAQLTDDAPPTIDPQASRVLSTLTLKHNERVIVLRASEIRWIEAEDYYVRLHSERGRHLLRTPLATLESQLCRHDFCRVHRGAIVNLHKVAELIDNGTLSVVLDDRTAIPVSRSRRHQVESRWDVHRRKTSRLSLSHGP